MLFHNNKMPGFQPPVISYAYKGHGGGGHNAGNFQGWGDSWEDWEKSQEAVKKKEVIVPASANKPVITNKEDYEEIRKLQGKEIKFVTYGERNTKGVGLFLIADTEDFQLPKGWEIRIFCDKHPKKEEWRNHNGEFKGVVKTVTERYDHNASCMAKFITLDLRTITIIPEENVKKPESNVILGSDLEWPDKFYEGYNNQAISRERFLAAVEKGCIHCGNIPTVFEEKSITFPMMDRIACGFCENSKNVQINDVHVG